MKEGFKRDFLNFMHVILHVVFDAGGGLLIDIAKNAVDASEAIGGSGDEKYERAFNAIKNDVHFSNASLKTSAINLAIELAVTALHGIK